MIFLISKIQSYLNYFAGNPANGTASRDSGLGLEGEYGPGQNLSNGFPGFPGALMAGFPGMANMSNGFPGFPFGFPAQGFAGRGDENSPVNGKTFLSAGMMDSGFMAGGNIDFIKMAALVRKSHGFPRFPSLYRLSIVRQP